MEHSIQFPNKFCVELYNSESADVCGEVQKSETTGRVMKLSASSRIEFSSWENSAVVCLSFLSLMHRLVPGSQLVIKQDGAFAVNASRPPVDLRLADALLLQKPIFNPL